MEQLDYLLGYAGVFLWAFGICQVKAQGIKRDGYCREFYVWE